MADDRKAASQGKGWVRIVLFVSLALNLMIAGLVAGVFFSGGPGKHARFRSDVAMPYTRAFTDSQRRDIGRSMRQGVHGKDGRDTRRFKESLARDFEAALTILRTEPFDERAMQDLLAAQIAQSQNRMQRAQQVLSAYLAEMSAEDRLAYADRLAQELESFRRRGGK